MKHKLDSAEESCAKRALAAPLVPAGPVCIPSLDSLRAMLREKERCRFARVLRTCPAAAKLRHPASVDVIELHVEGLLAGISGFSSKLIRETKKAAESQPHIVVSESELISLDRRLEQADVEIASLQRQLKEQAERTRDVEQQYEDTLGKSESGWTLREGSAQAAGGERDQLRGEVQRLLREIDGQRLAVLTFLSNSIL